MRIGIGVPLPNELIEKIRPILVEAIDSTISVLYSRGTIPTSFIFNDVVRSKTRERMLRLVMEGAAMAALESLGMGKNVSEAINELSDNLDQVKYKCEGYLLAVYDLTKDQ